MRLSSLRTKQTGVDKKDYVRPDGFVAAGKHKLVGDVKGVSVYICRIEKSDVSLALLAWNEHCLNPLQVFPCREVAFDVWQYVTELFDNIFGHQVIHEVGVETLHLVDEDFLNTMPVLPPLSLKASSGFNIPSRDGEKSWCRREKYILPIVPARSQ